MKWCPVGCGVRGGRAERGLGRQDASGDRLNETLVKLQATQEKVRAHTDTRCHTQTHTSHVADTSHIAYTAHTANS
eukprot:3281890-Rhodomonas_salina.2